MGELTRELIQSRSVVEGERLDFKSELHLEEPRAKEKFVDDVVAFLNAGGGSIVVGLIEKGGAWERWTPLIGDCDAIGLQVQNVVQSCIDPSPTTVSARAFALDDGFALVVTVGGSRMQPFQNRLNGAFRLRIGSQNKVLPRDSIGTYFKQFEAYHADLARLDREEIEQLINRGIMTEDGPTLTLAILPREHYEAFPRFNDRNGMSLTPGPLFHGRSEVFRGCPGGVEVKSMRMDGKHNCRLFISDEWFVHAMIVHPFSAHEGGTRIGFHEMQQELEAYLEHLIELIENAGVRGPFVTRFEFGHLRRNERVAWIFEHDGPVVRASRRLVERLDARNLAQEAFEAIRDASRRR